jgi:hypothetical protein
MNIVESVTDEYTSKPKKKNIWLGTPFEELVTLSPDERGHWGEKLVYTLITYLLPNIDCFWDSNKNTSNEDGSIWDILIGIFRTEVKTAFLGTNEKSFQHENLHKDKEWDKVLFVDVVQNGIWFTVQNKSDIPFGDTLHKILNVKSTPHLSGHKFDLSLYRCEKLVKSGDCFFYNLEDNEGLIKFLEFHFTSK